MELRRINFDHGAGCSCGDCTGGNAKSYFEGLEQKPNIEQLVPVPGPSGENSILVAGKTSATGILDSDGTDEALDSAAKANLLTADFDITVKPTTQNVVDSSDPNNNRVWTGLSRSILNFLGLKVVPNLLPPFLANGNILKAVGGIWTSATPDWEKYNSTTTTSFGYSISDIGVQQDFEVGAGLAYKFKNVVAIVDPNNIDNYIEGIVYLYSGTTLSLKIRNISGTGNTANWNVMLSAPEFLPYKGDPANYGKFYYNNNGIIEMRTSIESIGDTKVWFSATAPDTSWWLCDGSTKLLSESPGLYNLLVTQNGGVSSPFYVSGTSFTLPNATGAALVGVKSTGADSIGLGALAGSNILTGGIPTKNLPVTSPYNISTDVAGSETDGILAWHQRGGAGGADYNAISTAASSGSTVYNVTIEPKQNNTAGGQVENGAQDLDFRQRSLGMYLFIKAQ